MIANKPLRTLLLAALATPLLALCVELPQDPEPEDWSRHVSKACTSRRYGIRLAAARKVASGGDAAVAAVEAYAAEQGLNALPRHHPPHVRPSSWGGWAPPTGAFWSLVLPFLDDHDSLELLLLFGACLGRRGMNNRLRNVCFILEQEPDALRPHVF